MKTTKIYGVEYTLKELHELQIKGLNYITEMHIPVVEQESTDDVAIITEICKLWES